jgi:Asp-tRNA(Asn)/Glu-tRNA(Gln) amidotransferase A subunit family amidase
MSSDLYRLTATEILTKIKDSEVSVEEYAKSLLARIEARDDAVQAWAYLNPEQVIEQARALDSIPAAERGTLHGVAIAVKDVIYTKGESIFENASSTCLTRLQACPHSSIHPSTPTTPQKSTPAQL